MTPYAHTDPSAGLRRRTPPVAVERQGVVRVPVDQWIRGQRVSMRGLFSSMAQALTSWWVILSNRSGSVGRVDFPIDRARQEELP